MNQLKKKKQEELKEASDNNSAQEALCVSIITH